MAETTISWTSYIDESGKVVPGYTFNPWIGCTKVSGDPACAHCYAERENHLFRWCGGWGDEYPRRLTGEANWRKVKTWDRKAEKEGNHPLVFVASLADVFDPHPSILQEWRGQLFTMMENCKNLRFLVLTKRIERVSSIVPSQYWIDNPHIGLGFTAAGQYWFNKRIEHALKIPAAMHFVSIEPMTGPIDITKYTGYNPLHENTNGRNNLSGSNRWGIRSGQQRNSLESSQENWEQMEREDDLDFVRKGESGTSYSARISSNSSNVQQSSLSNGGTQNSLSSFFRRDTEWNDDKSQERNQNRQQTREFRDNDIFGASKTFNLHIEEQPTSIESIGGEKQPSNTETRPGGRNSQKTDERGDAHKDSGRLRNNISACIETSKNGTMGISWLICGGESMGGSVENRSKARPVNPQWLRDIRDECKSAGIPFHFKQWGEWGENGELVGRENSGCKLDGIEYKEFPKWFVE